MVTLGKVIKVGDAICNCIPVISTITNGIQLLYKLAHKVDRTANPVSRGWVDDIKIYVLNKWKHDCIYGLIPIFGNLTHLIHSVLVGLRSQQFTRAIVNGNIEVVQLYLRRHPQMDDKKATRALTQAAYGGKYPEVLSLLLKSRQWSLDSIIDALNRGYPSKWTRHDLIVDQLLEYYNTHFKGNQEFNSHHIFQITSALKQFVTAEECERQFEAAEKILDLLPNIQFRDIQDLLGEHSFRSYSTFRHKKGFLTDELRGTLLSKCTSCQLKDLENYFQKVRFQREELCRDIQFQNEYVGNPEKLNKDTILKEFDAIHKGTLTKLLEIADEPQNPQQIVTLISNAINTGRMEFVSPLLEKYEDRLDSQNKFNVLSKIHLSSYNSDTRQDVLKIFEFLFKRYNNELSDSQCAKLRDTSFMLNPPNLDFIDALRPNVQHT